MRRRRNRSRSRRRRRKKRTKCLEGEREIRIQRVDRTVRSVP